MRMVFVTQEDPFYVKRFFETFLSNYEEVEEIQGVVICRTMGRSTMALIKQMYGFYGTVDFCRVGLRYAWNRVLRALVGGVYGKRLFDVEQICRVYGIEVIRCQNINEDSVVRLLVEKKLDVIVSVAAPQIFKEAILRLPRWGCINVHNGRLPSYRGMLPSFWCMYHNEERSAVTIHTMDREIDRGKILLQREFGIKREESLDQLIKRTKVLGALYLIEVLRSIKAGTVMYVSAGEIGGSYFSFPTPAQVREFRRMGRRLL